MVNNVILVLAVLGGFPAKLGSVTRSSGSGSKNDVERTENQLRRLIIRPFCDDVPGPNRKIKMQNGCLSDSRLCFHRCKRYLVGSAEAVRAKSSTALSAAFTSPSDCSKNSFRCFFTCRYAYHGMFQIDLKTLPYVTQ